MRVYAQKQYLGRRLLVLDSKHGSDLQGADTRRSVWSEPLFAVRPPSRKSWSEAFVQQLPGLFLWPFLFPLLIFPIIQQRKWIYEVGQVLSTLWRVIYQVSYLRTASWLPFQAPSHEPTCMTRHKILYCTRPANRNGVANTYRMQTITILASLVGKGYTCN